jgi:hypothetical protein
MQAKRGKIQITFIDRIRKSIMFFAGVIIDGDRNNKEGY